MTVDILCRVVDNLGDIGFVYRLARALSELPDAPRLRLIVDDLSAFASLCPLVDPGAGFQRVGEWAVARWDAPGADAVREFSARRPRVVLECYACGRPDWFEEILFDEADTESRDIVNLEYLTAEPWARDFHRLPSLTRSPLVRKSVFMPGFEPGTGGLLIDRGFEAFLDIAETADGRLELRRAVIDSLGLVPGSLVAAGNAPAGNASGSLAPASLPPASLTPADAYWVVVFSYERDYWAIVADLARFAEERPLVAFVAAGRSSASFFEAWQAAGEPFPAVRLPLLPQAEWDRLLIAADFAIVRGEESFARACLAGKPFLWQCYPFADSSESDETGEGGADARGHLPKVYAFLDLLRKRLGTEDFSPYERLTLGFNGAGGELCSPAGNKAPTANQPPAASFAPTANQPPGELLAVLRSSALKTAFRAFSRDVRNLGNLAANLMTFLRDLG